MNKTMQTKDALLIEAKVLIEQLYMSHGFPRLEGWLERYEALMRTSEASKQPHNASNNL